MAKITRIKAQDPAGKRSDSSDNSKKTKISASEPNAASASNKPDTKAATPAKASKPSTPKTTKTGKKPFILFRPFIALGHYLKDSWNELRQVRWPTRKATWKMFFAVIIYTALFMIFITLLDLFFSWLFNLILNR